MGASALSADALRLQSSTQQPQNIAEANDERHLESTGVQEEICRPGGRSSDRGTAHTQPTRKHNMYTCKETEIVRY